MFEKLGGDHGTDRVASQVLRTGAAAPITEEAGDWVGAAGGERFAQDVEVDHVPSISLPAAGRRPRSLPALVASTMLARASPGVFERIPLRNELSGAHRDSFTRPAIQCGLGFRLRDLVIHGVNEIRVLHDVPEGTNATGSGKPALSV